ncbi:LuxR C-terminal-related transcriptional regulator [Polymorphospora sp. NPDC051019]|uniref:LuxR C-terminal-related transcriptional regulator n=1 Tax=Polymorphospora sp. NPDC051019 TaxID=3155725 RepID=UPI00343AC3EA
MRSIDMSFAGLAFARHRSSGWCGLPLCGRVTERVGALAAHSCERSTMEWGRVVSLELQLSELDAQIIEGIAAGECTIRIANRVYLSRQGVEYHVSKLLRHLRVSNRTALVAKAYALGILAAGTWPPAVTKAGDRPR